MFWQWLACDNRDGLTDTHSKGGYGDRSCQIYWTIIFWQQLACDNGDGWTDSRGLYSNLSCQIYLQQLARDDGDGWMVEAHIEIRHAKFTRLLFWQLLAHDDRDGQTLEAHIETM